MHTFYDVACEPEVAVTNGAHVTVFVEIPFFFLFEIKASSRATGKNPFALLVVKGQNEIRQEGCLMRLMSQDVLLPNDRCCKRRYKRVSLTDIILDVGELILSFAYVEFGVLEILDERLQLGNWVGCVWGRLRRRFVASC